MREAVPDFDRRWRMYVHILYSVSLGQETEWLPRRWDGGSYFACACDGDSSTSQHPQILKLQVEGYARDSCYGGERMTHDLIGSSTAETK